MSGAFASAATIVYRESSNERRDDWEKQAEFGKESYEEGVESFDDHDV
jgi:hypothetical protein